MVKTTFLKYSLGLLFASILCFGFFVVHFLTSSLLSEDVTVIFEPGQSVAQLTETLQAKGQLRHPKLFLGLTQLLRVDQKLKYGEYLFPKGARPLAVLKQLIQRDVIQHKITLVEGWSLKKIVDVLSKEPQLKHTLTMENITGQLGRPTQSLEGFIFPSTYFYVWGDSDQDVLMHAYKTMQEILTKAWDLRDHSTPYHNIYQALIVASLVEKETAVLQEKPLIAAVIIKRLQKGIPLQIDAAVAYGLWGHNDRHLTKKDLHTSTPYNTYLHYGLPPTPISMPGLDSILAALHPAKTSALYFVAKGDGTHVFSATLKEHNKAVAQYCRWLKSERAAMNEAR